MRSLAMAAVVGLLAQPATAVAADMTMDMGAGRAKPPVDGASSRAFAASMSRMMSGMDVKPTGRPDEDFVLMMMPHHQGAIDMAKVELRYGRDPTLRKMAEEIVAAQEKEIAEMKAWRAKNGR